MPYNRIVDVVCDAMGGNDNRTAMQTHDLLGSCIVKSVRMPQWKCTRLRDESHQRSIRLQLSNHGVGKLRSIDAGSALSKFLSS